MHHQLQSPLMQLPAELQLTIFEYAVLEPEPLKLNCACDSSYHGDYDRYAEDKKAWLRGELRAPEQPTLTRTCALLRSIALPMFYKLNVFRAYYCYQAEKHLAIKWLEAVGAANRRSIRDIAFVDENAHFDMGVPKDIKQLRRSKVVKEMGGRFTNESNHERCFHRLTFAPVLEDDFEGVEGLFVA